LRQVCEDKGNKAMVLLLLGHGVRVIGMGCWHHWGAVLVSVLSGGRGPCHGHLRVACLTAILEMLMRRDMICKCEGQQENGERTNHKSTMTKQQPIGTIYRWSVGWSVESQTHLKTGGERRQMLLTSSKARQATDHAATKEKKSDVVRICVMLEKRLLRHCALVAWCWLAKGGPFACCQCGLRCDK